MCIVIQVSDAGYGGVCVAAVGVGAGGCVVFIGVVVGVFEWCWWYCYSLCMW